MSPQAVKILGSAQALFAVAQFMGR